MEAAAETSARSRTDTVRWAWHFLVRLVPIVLVARVSFEVMFHNDWFLWNPHLTPGQIATLIAFVPAGLWAVADGYRLVPTGQVVALWAVVGAAVVIQNHLLVAALGFSQGMSLTVVETARWAEATLDFAVLHAVPAGILALLGAGLYRLRSRRAIRKSMGPAERGG